MFKKLFNLIKLSSSTSASVQPKLKVIVKTTKMLKTTILVALIAFLTKIGIYNKYTKPIFDIFGKYYNHIFRLWMLFNFFLAVYLIGNVGPIDVLYSFYKTIKNTLSNFAEFYSKITVSFIDYLKHIFGDGPKPPAPDLPHIPPRPVKRSSIYDAWRSP